MTKILTFIIIVLLAAWGVWQFWPEKPVTKIITRSVYNDDEVEVKNNKQGYIVWRMPDKITDDTLYAYKLYPDNDCQLMYVFENESPAGRKIAKLRLCHDTIAKFYSLDHSWLIAQTANCGIEFRYDLITKQQKISAAENGCFGSLIAVE